MHYTKEQKNKERGVTLLVAILVVGLVLSVGIAILNITLKQYILSGVSRDSAVALYAADAGLECGKYWDRLDAGSEFDQQSDNSVDCFGGSIDTTYSNGCATGASGECHTHELDLIEFGESETPVCASITVTKYHTDDENGISMIEDDSRICPQGFTCTKIESQGYNQSCSDFDSTPRTVERALRALYGGCRASECPAPPPPPSPETEQIFTSNGTFTVTEGMTELTFKVWGAGGGGGGGGRVSGDTGGNGAAGAYVEGTVSVGEGQQYNIRVGGGGEGGAHQPLPANDGSPAGSRAAGFGGGGGGYSAVFSGGFGQANTLLLAAGGGGGGGGDNEGYSGVAGGMGGALDGSDGSDSVSTIGGSGATTGSAGAGGTGALSGNGGGVLIGGRGGDGWTLDPGISGGAGGSSGGGVGGNTDNGRGGGGGGGGGYYGGGGGGAANGGSQGGAGGGGGSSYIAGSVSDTSQLAGSGTTPPNAAEGGGAGAGGAGGAIQSTGSDGEKGLVIVEITY